ncbi:MAG TPA: heparan-alpha-glucosaminide N-acetyltransferase domain-containing protein [Vicinamibacterales bacterium]|jgi:uncharacterized membrane protein|nr:heparan-alpha-glucosaminide N-acetyltransferase domain-containing protein [Vicinamibacterales bacterium]
MPKSRSTRRPYIDWLRGVAVLCMIEWHSIDAWSVTSGRDSAAFDVVGFIGGWAAPLFLFLAGVSLPLAGEARMARGLERRAAARTLERRGWQIFVLAHVFRFQSFLLNPGAAWNAILKPDILNVLGLGLVATAWCWGRDETFRGRLRWLIVPAITIVVVITPWAQVWTWPSLLYPRFEAYIRPVGNYGVFSLFPAVAYVFAGAAVGQWIGANGPDTARFHARLAAAGLAVLAVGGLARIVEPYGGGAVAAGVEAFGWRIGMMTLALSASWLLVHRRPADRWSPLVIFGRTSLFVYWVHVELAYGIFSYPLHHALPLPWAVAAFALLTGAMLAVAVVWMRVRLAPGQPVVPAHMAAAAG